MPEPYKEVYDLPEGGQITSLVIDCQGYTELCDSLLEVFMTRTEEARHIITKDRVANLVDALKAAKTIPLITRGTSTEEIFQRYEIETDKMCVIMRGEGERIFGQLAGSEKIRGLGDSS